MTYQVKYTNTATTPITVEDSGLNNSTSLSFVGKNYAGYAPVIAENFLHLLENFAKGSSPPNPVQGQLWYDVSTSLLKVYDGGWKSTGSVKKVASVVGAGGAAIGDLLVDTTAKQMYVWGGSSWLLIGPQYSSGNITGPKNEDIFDTNGTPRSILSFYVGNNIIAIISKSTFTPKAAITGFSSINRGINISSNNIDDTNGSTAITKLWGTAEKANALVVNDKTVDASNFLRSDQPTSTNYSFSIRSTGGLSIGSDLSFSIASDDTAGASSTVLYSKTNGKSIQFRLTSTNTPFTLVHLDATGKVGIGQNNTSPASTLDVAGLITGSTGLNVTGNTDSVYTPSTAWSAVTGSIKTHGGLTVALNSNFGGTVSTYGSILVNNLSSGNPAAGAVLLPGSTAATGLYDIGSSSRQFGTVYTTTIRATDIYGTVQGNVNGDVTGTAAGLTSTTFFKLAGDIESSDTTGTPFNGVTTNGTAILNTQLTTSVITNKTLVSNSLATDQLLIYRTTGASGSLNRTSKQTFMSNVPTVPVGSILPFAGPKSSLPNGYLLCDGGELLISEYTELYNLIGYTYRPASQLKGYTTFALPDLRGRFPLGIDSMDNNRQVPDALATINPATGLPSVLIDAGGSRNGVRPSTEPADRVTDVTADVLGGASGKESTTLISTNLPQHTHTLKDGDSQFYAASLGSVTTPNSSSLAGFGTGGGGGVGLNNSGGVTGLTGSPTPLSTVNPFLAINYIIFTGKLA